LLAFFVAFFFVATRFFVFFVLFVVAFFFLATGFFFGDFFFVIFFFLGFFFLPPEKMLSQWKRCCPSCLKTVGWNRLVRCSWGVLRFWLAAQVPPLNDFFGFLLATHNS